MYKYRITFFFSNNTDRSFEYYDLLDILYDLNYNLSLLDNSCDYWLIERINYE